MRKLAPVLLLFILFACSKESKPKAGDGVYVRIENSHSALMENVRVGTTAFGNLEPGMRTGYQLLNEAIYAPACQFEVNKTSSGAGVFVCGTPMPLPMEAGYYTFKIIASPQADYYGLTFTTD